MTTDYHCCWRIFLTILRYPSHARNDDTYCIHKLTCLCYLQKLTERAGGFVWNTNDGRPPRDVPECGFFNELCSWVKEGMRPYMNFHQNKYLTFIKYLELYWIYLSEVSHNEVKQRFNHNTVLTNGVEIHVVYIWECYSMNGCNRHVFMRVLN